MVTQRFLVPHFLVRVRARQPQEKEMDVEFISFLYPLPSMFKTIGLEKHEWPRMIHEFLICNTFMGIRVLFGGGCPLIFQITQLFDNMDGQEWFMNLLFVTHSWPFVSYSMVADALWYFRLLSCLITWMARNDSWIFYLWPIHGHSCHFFMDIK